MTRTFCDRCNREGEVYKVDYPHAETMEGPLYWTRRRTELCERCVAFVARAATRALVFDREDV